MDGIWTYAYEPIVRFPGIGFMRRSGEWRFTTPLRNSTLHNSMQGPSEGGPSLIRPDRYEGARRAETAKVAPGHRRVS